MGYGLQVGEREGPFCSRQHLSPLSPLSLSPIYIYFWLQFFICGAKEKGDRGEYGRRERDRGVVGEERRKSVTRN